MSSACPTNVDAFDGARVGDPPRIVSEAESRGMTICEIRPHRGG